jgi:hypothetical protein
MPSGLVPCRLSARQCVLRWRAFLFVECRSPSGACMGSTCPSAPSTPFRLLPRPGSPAGLQRLARARSRSNSLPCWIRSPCLGTVFIPTRANRVRRILWCAIAQHSRRALLFPRCGAPAALSINACTQLLRGAFRNHRSKCVRHRNGRIARCSVKADRSTTICLPEAHRRLSPVALILPFLPGQYEKLFLFHALIVSACVRYAIGTACAYVAASANKSLFQPKAN